MILLSQRLVTPCSALIRETYSQFKLVHRLVEAAFAPIFIPVPNAVAASNGGTGVGGGPTVCRDTTFAAGLSGRLGETESWPASEDTRHAREAGGKTMAREAVMRHLRQRPHKPLLVFPEGSITAGDRGAMRFSKFVFTLHEPVLPLAIRLIPALPLEADTVWDPLPVNIGFTLFQPWQTFILKPLPPLSARAGEEGGDFARRVAVCICSQLGIVATNHTTADKAAHLREVKQYGKYQWLRNQAHQLLRRNASA